jgi:hypothetical protein
VCPAPAYRVISQGTYENLRENRRRNLLKKEKKAQGNLTQRVVTNMMDVSKWLFKTA